MAPSAITPPAVEVKSLKVPMSSMPVDASSIGTKRKIICFSDFDGTIFMQDTGHILFNNFGCGNERRAVLDAQIHSGERSFREVSEEMWGSLDVPFESGFEVMKTALDIDPDFQTFHRFCINNSIPFNVISAGLKPVLRRVLDHFLGEAESAHIDIPVWRHENELGHDKALSINEYKDTAKLESDDGTIPMIVFIGDGVSDLPAAREADVLFARKGLRLEEYCLENKLAYIPFNTFSDIQREVIKIAKIDDEKTKGRGLPSNFNPRANLWRRVSSRKAVPLLAAFTPREEKMFTWPETFTTLTPMVEKPALTAPAA
ncbi:hypothetical protein H2199_007281 [Coniosporium tulheliwenetii]|uniref:Uncharacterized protein n=1 Tax=Coniosporium tulheliwenetii TaxID=3383036 RepID=A0ACC2YR16_9PEZI|nr:hypothetical protein H2199_007281 [Cladosporium sp. JES 115]